MANPIEAARSGLAYIAEKTQTPRDYLGSVVNRTIGRAAWMESTQRLAQQTYSPDDPKWIRGFRRVFKPICALGDEVIFPVGTRLAPRRSEKQSFGLSGTELAWLSVDLALWVSALWLIDNPGVAAGLKVVSNAATQTGLDLAQAGIKRIRKPRPSGTTLAV